MVEHKSLRPSEWNVWNEWMRAQRLMAQEIDTRLQDRFGISKADFSVLVTLSLSTESEMRAVDVANALGWEKSRLSHQLSRMERRGFVKRSESGAIGRRTGIALTSKGRGLAEQAISDFSLLAEEKAIDLGLEIAPHTDDDDVFEVLGEPHSLSVLLNNLLDNAIKHTPNGGRVDVVLRREGAGVFFEVRDSGCGIPETELGRVCDRFYRGTETQGEGSGLGLAIVTRVAKCHRVDVALQNNPDGRGLTVTVSPFKPVNSDPRLRPCSR